MSKGWRGPRLWALTIAIILGVGLAVLAGMVRADVEQNPVSISNNATENCSGCHAYLRTNRTPRQLAVSKPEHGFELEHGSDRFWCLECHSARNRDRLLLANGSSVELNPKESTQLCAQCHGPIYQDWKEHIHGRWVGSWKNATPDKYCVGCHNPHDPDFGKVSPAPPPDEPPDPEQAEQILPQNYTLFIGTAIGVGILLIGYAGWPSKR